MDRVSYRAPSIKDYIYLIIPIFCIYFWALFWLFNHSNDPFISHQEDFKYFYRAGKNFPELYSNPGYYYTPCLATIFAISLSLLAYDIAYYIFYCLNFIFATIIILEFNKILILLDVKEKLHRFLFLIVVSNGWLILHQFTLNQSKFLVGFILIFIFSREIKNKKENITPNLKYDVINYFLLVFVIGLVPLFIFFLLIYLFRDIHKKDVFKRGNVRKYGLIILIFIAQNFLFLIYPFLILDFIESSIEFMETLPSSLYFYPYLYASGLNLPILAIAINLISFLIFSILSLFLISKLDLEIEFKFGILSLLIIIFTNLGLRVMVIIIPFIILLFIPFLNQEEKGMDFIKENILILIGLITVAFAFIIPKRKTNYYPYFNRVEFLIQLRVIIFIIIISTILLVLYLQRKNDTRRRNNPNKYKKS